MNTQQYAFLISLFFIRNYNRKQTLCRRDLIKYVDSFSKRYTNDNTLTEQAKYATINKLIDLGFLKEESDDCVRVVSLSDTTKNVLDEKILIENQNSYYAERARERDKHKVN